MTVEDLVLRAMWLAEFAHRNRPEGPHTRKAPEGGDRPAYFIPKTLWRRYERVLEEFRGYGSTS